MALLEIPVFADVEAFKFTTDLEGQNYEFDFSWSSRCAQFSMTIRDALGVDLISTPAVGNSDLLGRFQNEKLPPGSLFVFDSTGQQREPTIAGFGTEFLLYYQESV